MSSSVKVAIRCRPLNAREIALESASVVKIKGTQTDLINPKSSESTVGSIMDRSITSNIISFTFDHCYLSPGDSQEKVYQDLGKEVVMAAYDGFNACVFAYGQTGSGKTFSMMGTESEPGLIPRICCALFEGMQDSDMTYRVEVSYLEIYNESVRDLLCSKKSIPTKLKVREHPKEGPYVEDLSIHGVTGYKDIESLIAKGNTQRTTASTLMNEGSSRSHAIFTIVFKQAKFNSDVPLEKHSKIHLVDLAGSERSQSTGATGERFKEACEINKSLVLLGNVISTLSKKGKTNDAYVSYRSSVLTWLLKDSLGGNSKTIMVAAVSPAACNYSETLSTLRYASRAKLIVNRPVVNEDSNVRLIRQLRAENDHLRSLLAASQAIRNNNPEMTSSSQSINNQGRLMMSSTTLTDEMVGEGLATSMNALVEDPNVMRKMEEREERIATLRERWADQWQKDGGQTGGLIDGRSRDSSGIELDPDLPYLIGLEDGIHFTGSALCFHIKDGITRIGSEKALELVLIGEGISPHHCQIECSTHFLPAHPEKKIIKLTLIVVSLDCQTQLNTNPVLPDDGPVALRHGCILQLGHRRLFRIHNPLEPPPLLRQRFFSSASMGDDFSDMNSSIMSLMHRSTDLCVSSDQLSFIGWEEKMKEEVEILEEKRRQVEESRLELEMKRNYWLQEQEKREKLSRFPCVPEDTTEDSGIESSPVHNHESRASNDASPNHLNNSLMYGAEVNTDTGTCSNEIICHTPMRQDQKNSMLGMALFQSGDRRLLSSTMSLPDHHDSGFSTPWNSPFMVTSSILDEQRISPDHPERRPYSVNGLASSQETSWVHIPGYLIRGRFFGTHVVYEIKLSVGSDEWTIYRRFRNFVQLHNDIRRKFSESHKLFLPPKKWIFARHDPIAQQRMLLLQNYLDDLLKLVWVRHCRLASRYQRRQSQLSPSSSLTLSPYANIVSRASSTPEPDRSSISPVLETPPQMDNTTTSTEVSSQCLQHHEDGLPIEQFGRQFMSRFHPFFKFTDLEISMYEQF